MYAISRKYKTILFFIPKENNNNKSGIYIKGCHTKPHSTPKIQYFL